MVWHYLWMGVWMGFGAEISFFLLWVFWHLLHRRVAHKFDPEHLFHVIHNYFSN